MSEAVLPQAKQPKLIVVIAFDRDEDGELFAVLALINSGMKTERSGPQSCWPRSTSV